MSKREEPRITVTMPLAWAKDLAFAAGNLLNTDPGEAREFLGPRRYRRASAGYSRLNEAIRLAAMAGLAQAREDSDAS